MKEKIITICIFLIIFGNQTCFSQVAINTSGASADPSAVLDVSSTSKGFLPPRMTALQRSEILTPVDGLLVYQTDGIFGFYYFKSGLWTRLNDAIISTTYICSQIWMDRNLDVTTYQNGDPIPMVENQTQWNSLTTGAWCYYNNDPTTAAVYGKLYNWYAVTDPRGLAPNGYHIPNNEEWDILQACLGGAPFAGGQMKYTNIPLWISPNTNATNITQFNAVPGGYRYFSGFAQFGYSAKFWTSSPEFEYITPKAYHRSISYDSGFLYYGTEEKYTGKSVRCVKD